MKLTIRDYHNISTIKTYYNEIFDYILEDLTNYGDSFLFAIYMNKYKNIIDYSKFVFSPRLIEHFIDWIKNVNFAIEEHGREDAIKAWVYRPCSININFFIYNIDMLNDQRIPITVKMNKFLMKVINNSSRWEYRENFLITELKSYNLKTKQPYYNKSLHHQWKPYPEIRIITRFVEYNITQYCLKKRLMKKNHQDKYKEVMKEILYYPNLGVEYFKAIHSFDSLKQ